MIALPRSGGICHFNIKSDKYSEKVTFIALHFFLFVLE